MTKPKNFPGRVNKRRMDALSRLNLKQEKNIPELHSLQSKIINPEIARSIKTKKHRNKESK